MVRCLALNSLYLASGSDDRTARIWRKDLPMLVSTIAAHSDFIRAMAFCQSYVERLVTAGDDRKVILWNAETGECLREYPHEAAVIALHLCEGALLTASQDGRLRVWQTDAATIVRETLHPASVTALAVL